MATTEVINKPSKIKFIGLKLWSIPGVAVLAFVGLLLGMCLYYGPLETNTTVTNWYHGVLPNAYWRHLLVRAYPQTMFAAWFAQCAAFVAVVGGAVKKEYRIFKTHELFWRPVVGLVFTIPGALAMAGFIWLWDKHNFGAKLHTNHMLTVLNSVHPGVWDQFGQSVILDGDKKFIVLAGSFIFGLWWMKSYFFNVQGWLAEHSVIRTRARNRSRALLGKKEVKLIKWYHYLLPGFMDRILYVDSHNPHWENHGTVNNVIYRAFQAVVVAGILGGLYIMFFLAQGTALAITVVH